MWEKYFQKIYNENLVRNVRLNDTHLPKDILYLCRITEEDIKSA